MEEVNHQPSGFLSEAQLEELRSCRQGDVIDFQQQVWIADGDLPTTVVSRDHTSPGQLSRLSERAAAGVVVLTQTCDLVPRPGRDRPFVAVAPVVTLPEHDMQDAIRRRRPQYAHLPAYSEGKFFADLDRVTTIETGVLLRCTRTPGVVSDTEQADFAAAVARKFGRFAFPDDFASTLSRWRSNVVSKHDKEASPEGTLYRTAVDVRTAAAPSWQDSQIDVSIFVMFQPGFLPPTDPEVVPLVGSVQEIGHLKAPAIAIRLLEGVADPHEGLVCCDRLASLWADMCEPSGVIRSVSFELVSTDEMSVETYLSTYSLDLEFLS